jgi:hypothetical protein
MINDSLFISTFKFIDKTRKLTHIAASSSDIVK